MAKKITSVLVLAAFAMTSTGCGTMRTRPITSAADLPGGRAKILSLVKTSGEEVIFARTDPGRIRGGAVVGTAMARISVPLEVKGPVSEIKRRPNGDVYAVTDGSGRVYSVQKVLREGEDGWFILFNDRTVQSVSVPISEVRQITHRRSNTFLTILAIGVPSLVGFLLWASYMSFKDM